jgi:hypothetical protein
MKLSCYKKVEIMKERRFLTYDLKFPNRRIPRTYLFSSRKLALGICCLLSVMISSPSHTQNTFQQTYGGNSDDGGWSVQQTSDGGYIITGITESFGSGGDDVYLIKTDSIGDTLWTKTYGTSDHDWGMSVKETPDGGYIITGSKPLKGSGSDVYLIKTNSSGDTLWTKGYGGNSFDEGNDVEVTPDNGFIVVGYTRSYGSGLSDVYLIKTDSIGDTLWTRTYGGGSFDEGFSVKVTSDGGYIITGYTRSSGAGGYDVYLVKTDSLGGLLWTRTFGGSSGDFGESVQQTSDGGYIVAGYTRSFGAGGRDIYLIKTDSLGGTQWIRTYGGSFDEWSYSVQETRDGRYILAGGTESYGAGFQDVYLIKVDNFGDTVWTRTYGGNNDDLGLNLQQTRDSRYVISGYTESFGQGGFDAYLIKTDGGNIYDVGVVTLDVPGDTVFAGSLYTVQTTVRNFGNVLETFDVIASIGGYKDTVQVVDLLPDSSIQVTFNSWQVPSFDSTNYTMAVCTQLSPDSDPFNDCVQKSIFAYRSIVHDGGVVSLDSPGDTVFADSIYAVQATVRNFGNVLETFDVIASIGGYSDTVQVIGLIPDSSVQVTFGNWQVPSNDSTSYTMTVCAQLFQDNDPLNDCSQKSIFAYRGIIHDGGVVTLDAPGDTVITDSLYAVQATVRNFGSFVETFDVIATIGNYTDTVQVTGLAPDSSIQVAFSNWTVPSPDSTTYTMTVCTQVSLDNDPTNNCIQKFIFAHESQGPLLLSAIASDNAIPVPGIDDDDQVLIVFNEPTNKPVIVGLNINTVLILSGGHSWTDGLGTIGSAIWNPAGDSLLITLSTNFGQPTIAVGDTITPDGVTIKDSWGNPAVISVVITGSFDPQLGIDENSIYQLPITSYQLFQNFPNPFHKLTAIRYQLKAPSHTTLKVYDITGRLIETLVDEFQEPGVYQVEWNSRIGVSPVRSGIYFYRLQAREGQDTVFKSTKKLILLK